MNGILPESLGQISNLEVLVVRGNSKAGVLTEKNFVRLSKLEYLFLSKSAFIWVPPFQLSYLSLGYLGPKLPIWLYTQRSLTMLWICDSTILLEEHDKFRKFVVEIENLFLILSYQKVL